MSHAILRAMALALLLTACAADTGPAARGYGSPGYEWGEMTPERIEVLRLTGDIERGRESFSGCRGCHKADGIGILDGTYPRLTGQHASVIIKQVTDTRAGLRMNPKMRPFASEHALTAQEIADVAVFLESAATTVENGKGPGDNLALGERLYRDKCVTCHGEHGEGNAGKAYPVVAAQHYGYLLREMRYVRDGKRGNSHPKMVELLRHYELTDLEAMADYMSRLPDYRTLAKKEAKP